MSIEQNTNLTYIYILKGKKKMWQVQYKMEATNQDITIAALIKINHTYHFYPLALRQYI